MSGPGPRWTRRRFIGASALGLAGLAGFGCAPPAPSSVERAGGQAARVAVDRSAVATVNMAAFGTPFTMTNAGAVGGDVGGDLQMLCHSALSIIDHDASPRPMLAEKLPSIDDGTWVVNGDGSMRMTLAFSPTSCLLSRSTTRPR